MGRIPSRAQVCQAFLGRQSGRWINVRTVAAVACLVALLSACGSTGAGFDHAATTPTCGGYTPASPAHHLTNQDDGRRLTVHVCDSIWIVLTGSTTTPWRFPETSETSVLAVVPLPLPAPPPGGTRAVYLAKNTGSATLSSSRSISCPPDAMCVVPPPWTVNVTVVE